MNAALPPSPPTHRLSRRAGRWHLALVLATALPAPAARLGDPLVADDDNIVANADFRHRDPQQRPLRWISGPGPQTATITTKERHGAEKDDCALRVEDTSDAAAALVRSEKRIAVPGTTYAASAWVKGGNDTPATFYLEFWNQNAQRIGVTTVVPDFSPTWQQVKAALAAPDHTTHVTVAIATTQKGQGVSYWDDVHLAPQHTYSATLECGVRELFVDNHRVASLVDVQRVVHPAVKSPPLLTPTEPWEGHSAYIYGTVLKDQPAGSGYRMWYTAFSGEYYLCYATSRDGITWTKPKLGLIDYKGSKENNICHVGGGTLVYDPHTNNESRRYKLLVFHSDPQRKMGYWAYFSPDGLTWTQHGTAPVLTYGDVANVCYDPARRRFIATSKQRMLVSNTSVTPGKMDRAAFVSVSDDFTHWSAPGAPGSAWVLAVEGDHADDFRTMAAGGIEAQIYGMPIYPYEGLYLGLPWVFDITSYTTGTYAVTGDGPIQPQIAASRDLRHWSRPARAPVLPLGRAGAWDDGTLYTSSTLHVTDREVELYFGAMSMPHGASTKTQTQSARIAKATWRRDGFVSLHNAGDDPGFVTTRPLACPGARTLHVNARLTGAGSLKVEVLDADDQPLPGYTSADALPISGDSLAAIVQWRGGRDIARLAGQPIVLRFHLTGGDLFSYWFE